MVSNKKKRPPKKCQNTTFDKNSIQLILFLFGLAITFGILLLDWRLCSPFPGYGFNPPGMGWIMCVGPYNGILLGASLSLFYDGVAAFKRDHDRALLSISLSSLAMLILFASNPDTCGDTMRDKLVRNIGYYFFYVPSFSRLTPDDAPLPAGLSMPIRPHQRVTAKTPFGLLKITAGSGRARKCSWDFGTRTVEAPYPIGWHEEYGPNWTGYNCLRLTGATRICYSEQKLDFNGSGPALAWLYGVNTKEFPLSYNKTGLVVGWTKTGTCGYDDINVCVFQLTINGKTPCDLLGGDDSRVVVEEGK